MQDISFFEFGFSRVLTAVVIVSAGYLTCLAFSTSSRLNNRLSGVLSGKQRITGLIMFHRLLGGTIFLLLPLLCILLIFKQPLSDFGAGPVTHDRTLRWLIPTIPAIVVFHAVVCRWDKNLAVYPQIRAKDWNLGLLSASAGGWILYLTGYEFMFRGFLLFACLQAVGYWQAIGINLVLYALAHLPKGREEMIGSVVLGLLLCVATLESGTVLYAICAHIMFALVNEWFSLAYQPEMHLTIGHRKL